MTRRLRVAHLPARTPYARKLSGDEFTIINGTRIASSGEVIPDALSTEWILDHRPLDWLDVVHLHHLEFEDEHMLERLLTACEEANVRVVYTVHDLTAMFGANEDLHRRTRLVHAARAGLVCLTEGSATELIGILGEDTKAWLAPHGYVVDPETVASLDPPAAGDVRRYLMYGALRPNRDHLSTIVNWSLHTRATNDRLHLLMRGLSSAHMADTSQHVMDLVHLAGADPRIEITMRGYPTDADIVTAGACADVLVLPYLWGTHSGQLELAFDLALFPLVSDVGHLRAQHAAHQDTGLVDEPEWFDWSTGNPYAFGERFVTALEHTAERLNTRQQRADRRAFADYRRTEHAQVLAVYAAAYQEL